LSLVAYVGFQRLRSLAPSRCQPFDRNRQGVALGEGAAFLFLERAGAARARGRRGYGAVLAHGYGFDAYNMAVPHPDGAGGEQAVRAALRAARLGPADVDYINAHGTGTPSNDKAETTLVKRVFGARAYGIPISSTKSMVGHTMGAASALEAVACLIALERGVIPPTINYEVPDPECDLDYVPNRARCGAVRVALSAAFAMGGDASALLLARADGGGG
jgi:3-oxoacyl-[acyl-carrier-protein] synthase II